MLVRFVPKFLTVEAENNWLFVHKNFWLKRKIPSFWKSSKLFISFDNDWKRFLVFVWMVSNLQILQLIWYFSSIMSLLRLFHQISGLKFLTTTTARVIRSWRGGTKYNLRKYLGLLESLFFVPLQFVPQQQHHLTICVFYVDTATAFVNVFLWQKSDVIKYDYVFKIARLWSILWRSTTSQCI